LPVTEPVGMPGSREAAREGAAAGAASERRELETRLQQTQRLEAVGLLAGGVAHDFNNLLTAIRGYAQIALESAGDDDGLRESLDEILLASARAADVTRQLLAFSRRQTLRPRTFDLNQAVLESGGFLPGVLGARIRVDTALAPGICGLFADPGQVEQVLINLAVSARDRMAGGGTLTIETGRTELGAASAVQQGIDPGPYIVLRITDTGEGMDAESVAHAFDPFFTTMPAGAGSGLRLATVYGIVRQSGGAISLDSAPGSRTSFRILLPQREVEMAALAPPPSPLGGSERILLVEDEDAVRRLTARLLEAQGYEVVAVETAVEAIELAAATRFDLLAADVVMPEMDGGRLAARLRDDRPELPVLFLSGYARDAVLGDVLTAAHTCFLQKPYSPDELAQAVRATLGDGIDLPAPHTDPG
jgi:two-component system, cell cycle sensor histidine kinase and response regulator CckA